MLWDIGLCVLACGVLVASAFYACIAVFAIIIQSRTKSPRSLPRICASEVLRRCQTGDIMMTNPSEAIGTPVMERSFLHASIVWVHPTLGPCAVEYVRTAAPFTKHSCMGRNFRVTRLDDYLTLRSRFVLWRPLVRCPDAVRRAIPQTFADLCSLEYNRLLDDKDMVMVFMLALAVLDYQFWGPVVRWREAHAGPRSTFCSKFVADVLLRSGVIDAKRFLRNGARPEYIAPTLFLKSMGFLDGFLADGVEYGEEMVVTKDLPDRSVRTGP